VAAPGLGQVENPALAAGDNDLILALARKVAGLEAQLKDNEKAAHHR
jgi:hypothetical protein